MLRVSAKPFIWKDFLLKAFFLGRIEESHSE